MDNGDALTRLHEHGGAPETLYHPVETAKGGTSYVGFRIPLWR